MGEEIRSFRDLVAWRLGMDLALLVYQLIDTFPPDERFGLTRQIRRAAVSVPSNIAEGFGRGRGPDFARFLRTARGSLFEIDTQLEIAERLGYASDGGYDQAREILDEARRVLAGLLRSVEP